MGWGGRGTCIALAEVIANSTLCEVEEWLGGYTSSGGTILSRKNYLCKCEIVNHFPGLKIGGAQGHGPRAPSPLRRIFAHIADAGLVSGRQRMPLAWLHM